MDRPTKEVFEILLYCDKIKQGAALLQFYENIDITRFRSGSFCKRAEQTNIPCTMLFTNLTNFLFFRK